MSATITTTDGTYTGRTITSIVRRVYGRKAYAQLHRSLTRNPVVLGQILAPARGAASPVEVRAAILFLAGDFGH